MAEDYPVPVNAYDKTLKSTDAYSKMYLCTHRGNKVRQDETYRTRLYSP
jgi:hypothetical protein